MLNIARPCDIATLWNIEKDKHEKLPGAHAYRARRERLELKKAMDHSCKLDGLQAPFVDFGGRSITRRVLDLAL